MNKKKLKIIGVVLAFAISFPLHFLYEKFPSFITSVFGPVNESIWEHMKILFGSILLSGVFQKVIVLIKKENYNNICFSNFVAALASIPIFLILFLPIYNIVGENMFVSISIMLLTIILAEIISYIIMNKRDLKLERMTIVFVIMVYIAFTILTYYPFKSSIFIDQKTKTYGITEKND